MESAVRRGSMLRILASNSVGIWDVSVRLCGRGRGTDQPTIVGFPEPNDLVEQPARDELADRHAQVHAPDADAGEIATGAVAVEPHAVVALLAVGVVVEPAGRAGVRQ